MLYAYWILTPRSFIFDPESFNSQSEIRNPKSFVLSLQKLCNLGYQFV